MQRLSYQNLRGQTVDFREAAPFVFWKVTGLGMPDARVVSTESPGQSGYSLHEVTLENRVVRVSGHVDGKARTDLGERRMYELRRALQATCNPLSGQGILFYENDSGKWRESCVLQSVNYGQKATGIQTVELTFECPSPFWLSDEETVVKLSYISGGMKFPIRLPNRFGVLGYRVAYDNVGNEDTPIEMTIEGASLNPKIENKTTGEWIQLNRELRGGERIYINTDPDNLSVRLITIDPETNAPVSQNAFGYLSRGYTLFSLKPGNNVLDFTSDDESRNVRITITFRQRYIGV